MPTSSGIDTLCAHCGKPMIGAFVCGSGGAYHPECTRGPDYKPETFQPIPFAGEDAMRREMALTREARFLRGVLEGLKHWDLPPGARESIDKALDRKF